MDNRRYDTVGEEINQTFNSYYLEMGATEGFLKGEIKTLVDKLRDKEEYIKKLEEENKNLKEERDFFKEQAILWRKDYKNEYEGNIKLNERIRFLEQCLDNKEKVNLSMREELQRYKDMWDSGEEIVINIDKDGKVTGNTKWYTDC